MHVVAIRGYEGPEDARAKAIAAATGLSPFEARTRAKGPGPRVVITFGDEAEANRVAAALERAGLLPLVVPAVAGSDGPRFDVQTVRFDAEGLRLESPAKETLEVPARSVSLLVRGTRITKETREETTRGRAIALGRAVATGGLVLTKRTEKTTTTVSETRGGFLRLVAAGFPDVVFAEAALRYESLGAAMQPSRAANFAHVVGEIRARAPGALYDERLLTRAGQVHLLSGMLDPETWLDVAVRVLSQTLLARSPYRSVEP